MHRCVDRRLGRAIAVPHAGAASGQSLGQLADQYLAARHQFEAGAAGPPPLRPAAPDRRGRLDQGTAGLVDQRRQAVRVEHGVAVGDHDMAALDQRQEESGTAMSNDSVATASMPSPARNSNSRLNQVSRLTTQRCGTTTPFGLPVEPDV